METEKDVYNVANEYLHSFADSPVIPQVRKELGQMGANLYYNLQVGMTTV